MRQLWWCIFTIIAGASFLLCAAAMFMDIRSYSIHESWTFTPQRIAPPAALGKWSDRQWKYNRQVFSSGGYVQSIFSEEIDYGSRFPRTMPGYRRSPRTFRGPITITVQKRPGERRWSHFGIHYYFNPTTTANTPPVLLKASSRPNEQIWLGGPTLYPGLQSLAISWWLIIAAFAILPGVWCVGCVGLWKRLRLVRRVQRNCCPACGYDMRATPDRCPECGMCSNGSLSAQVP